MIRFRHRLELGLLESLSVLLRLLPRSVSIRVGEAMGSLVHLTGLRMRVTMNNLQAAFPERDPREIGRVASGCYRHFGALLAEFARLPLLKPENVLDLVEVEDRQVLDDSQARGRGGIVVSGHLGNWELMGSAMAVLDYPVSYVVTGQENELVEALMDRLRQSTGVQIIRRREAVKGVVKALKENRLVAILSDQDAHEAGAFVPFFGRLASTPRGAALFALRTGADLIFAASHRRGLGKLKVTLELMPREGLPPDRDQATLELVRRFTALLESAIRRQPEQWFWMHRRWKTLPPP